MIHYTSRQYELRKSLAGETRLTMKCKPYCCSCGLPMRMHENCMRTYKELDEGAIVDRRIYIPRYYCPGCRRDHRILPTFLLPNARYTVSTIEKILEDPTGIIFDNSLHTKYRTWLFLLMSQSDDQRTGSLSPRIRRQELIRLIQQHMGDQEGWLLRYIEHLL